MAGLSDQVREILAAPEGRAEVVALASALSGLSTEALAWLVDNRPESRLDVARFAAASAGAATGVVLRAHNHEAVRPGQGWTDTAGAASFLGQPERWVHENWHRLPFAKKWDARNLAFNVEGMKRWDGRLLPG